MTMKKNKSIGLALSGGGARGIAHIGVIKALQENDIHPDIITGASAGSIVGALLADGKSVDEMLSFVRDSSIMKIWKLVLPNRGITSLQYLKDRLKLYIGEDTFESLKTPLYIAVTNLNSGKCEMIHSGKLIDIIMASSSIPLVFQPVEIDGQSYVDGGVLDNLPVGPLLDQKMDLIIGVNVMPHVAIERKSLQGVIGVTTRCFDLAVLANTLPSLKHCDVIIEPKGVNEFNIFNFSKVDDLFEIGYKEAQSAIPLIKEALAAEGNT
ncbi:MAG: phospholipase [Saprospiraceae bacterium]|nr:MAG: phospholipase [Saprospiraceae bacterium]